MRRPESGFRGNNHGTHLKGDTPMRAKILSAGLITAVLVGTCAPIDLGVPLYDLEGFSKRPALFSDPTEDPPPPPPDPPDGNGSST